MAVDLCEHIFGQRIVEHDRRAHETAFHPDRRLEIVSPVARDVPAFLLHLISQVTINASTATEYLDRRVGIARTPKELLERRIGERLRLLGKKRADEALKTFVRDRQARAAQGLAERIKSLPIVDGQPDIAALGDPALVAKQWTAALHLTHNEQLQQLLAFLEEVRVPLDAIDLPAAKSSVQTKTDGMA